MKSLFSRVVALSAALAAIPTAARPTGDEVVIAVDEGVQPAFEAPAGPPPGPAVDGAAPPAEQIQGQAAGSGQWVHTSQYGWIWMPYGNAYTYLPADGGAPDMYVYYPAVGWCWVVAPWLWGFGPQPFFGVVGPWRFAWWGHGFGHWYGFRGTWAGWRGHGFWHGGRWNDARGAFAAPSRAGFASRGFGAAGNRAQMARGFGASARGFSGPGTFRGSAPRGGAMAMPRAGSGHSGWGRAVGGAVRGGGRAGHGGHR